MIDEKSKNSRIINGNNLKVKDIRNKIYLLNKETNNINRQEKEIKNEIFFLDLKNKEISNQINLLENQINYLKENLKRIKRENRKISLILINNKVEK